MIISSASSDEKVLRSRHHVITPSVLSMPMPRKRRQLTPEELEQRRKKVLYCPYIHSIMYVNVSAYKMFHYSYCKL